MGSESHAKKVRHLVRVIKDMPFISDGELIKIWNKNSKTSLTSKQILRAKAVIDQSRQRAKP